MVESSGVCKAISWQFIATLAEEKGIFGVFKECLFDFCMRDTHFCSRPGRRQAGRRTPH